MKSTRNRLRRGRSQQGRGLPAGGQSAPAGQRKRHPRTRSFAGTARPPFSKPDLRPDSAARTLRLLRVLWRLVLEPELRLRLGVRTRRAAKQGEAPAAIVLDSLTQRLSQWQAQLFHASEASKRALGLETDEQVAMTNLLIPAVRDPDFDVSEFFPDGPDDSPPTPPGTPDPHTRH